MSYTGAVLECLSCGEVFQGVEPGDVCPICDSQNTVYENSEIKDVRDLADVLIRELDKAGIGIERIAPTVTNGIGITIGLSDGYVYIEARPEGDQLGAVAKRVYSDDRATSMRFLDNMKGDPIALMQWIISEINKTK
jgi:hypothetical protein